MGELDTARSRQADLVELGILGLGFGAELQLQLQVSSQLCHGDEARKADHWNSIQADQSAFQMRNTSSATIWAKLIQS